MAEPRAAGDVTQQAAVCTRCGKSWGTARARVLWDMPSAVKPAVQPLEPGVTAPAGQALRRKGSGDALEGEGGGGVPPGLDVADGVAGEVGAGCQRAHAPAERLP